MIRGCFNALRYFGRLEVEVGPRTFASGGQGQGRGW